jgi:hypothetical protein
LTAVASLAMQPVKHWLGSPEDPLLDVVGGKVVPVVGAVVGVVVGTVDVLVGLVVGTLVFGGLFDVSLSELFVLFVDFFDELSSSSSSPLLFFVRFEVELAPASGAAHATRSATLSPANRKTAKRAKGENVFTRLLHSRSLHTLDEESSAALGPVVGTPGSPPRSLFGAADHGG